MDAQRIYRIVQSVKYNNVRFDTHDLVDFDALLPKLDIIEQLNAAEKSVLRRDLKPLAEMYQNSEMSRLAARQQDELLVW